MLGFPGSSAGEESTWNSGDPGSIPGSGRSPGKGIGYPLQYSWASLVQMVKNLHAMWETWIRSPGWEDPLEKGKATHSSILDWRIPWTEEPGRLQPMGSQRVRHNWPTFTFIRCHLQLNGYKFEQAPGDGEGQGSLACCSPCGRKDSEMTEKLNHDNKNAHN